MYEIYFCFCWLIIVWFRKLQITDFRKKYVWTNSKDTKLYNIMKMTEFKTNLGHFITQKRQPAVLANSTDTLNVRQNSTLVNPCNSKCYMLKIATFWDSTTFSLAEI